MESFSLSAPVNQWVESIPGLPPAQNIPGKIRLVKDCLRVGRYAVGKDAGGTDIFWDCTPQTLADLAANFSRHQSAGIHHPLCWGHGAGADTDDRDSVVDLANVWSDGQTLWCAVYVTPEQKADLTSKRREVSVRVVKDWMDGVGRVWDGPQLHHVAIVTHAALPAQKPFIELAAPSASPSKGSKTMTPAIVLEVINKLLTAAGYNALPDSVSEQNFDEIVPVLVDALVGDQTEDPAPEVTDVTQSVDPGNAPPINMAADLAKVVADLTARVEAFEAEKTNAKKAAYDAKANALGAQGVEASKVTQLIDLGAKIGFDQAVLDVVASAHKIDLGSKTKGAIDPTEPKGLKFSEENIQAARKALNLKPKK